MQKRKKSYPSLHYIDEIKGGVSYSFQYFQNIYFFLF